MRLKITARCDYDGQLYEPGETLNHCPPGMIDELIRSGKAENPDLPTSEPDPEPESKPKGARRGK